jgi:ribosomal protein S6--L-glutamate ligase
MNIAILSRGPRLYSTRRLKEAAGQRGHDARVLNPLACSIEVARGSPRLYYKNKKLSSYDAVIPRIGASITFFGTAVLRQFEQMGTFCLNPSHAISVSRDKLRALQVLSRHHIRIPTTLFVRHVSEILPGIDRMGGPPVVVKLLEGTQGIGVILADSTKVAEAIIETLAGPAKMSVLLQKFVAESKGRDIRAFVVGNRVVAAMRRTASGDDFRSNIHRGGSAQVVELDEEYQRTAVHAAQIMGLRVAGVDLLEGKNGPVLMEVNSSPGLEGIENATGVDIAGEIVALIENEVLFPDIDIRQRLTLQSGYGVIELPVDERSELCGKTIRDSRLRERDVLVLTIQRGSVTIPNPRTDREISAGDVLLCFGKALTLRGLAPPPRPSRKKKKGQAADRSSSDETPSDA